MPMPLPVLPATRTESCATGYGFEAFSVADNPATDPDAAVDAAADADAEAQLEQLRRIRDALVGRNARKVAWAMRPGALSACIALVVRPVRSLRAAQVRTQGAALLSLLCQSAGSSHALRAALFDAEVPHSLLHAVHESKAELLAATDPASAHRALGVSSSSAINELTRTLHALTRALAAFFTLLSPLATAPSRTGIGYGRAYFALIEAALVPANAMRERPLGSRKSPLSTLSARQHPRQHPRPHARPPTGGSGRSSVNDEQVRAQLRRAIHELYEPRQVELLCSLLHFPDLFPPQVLSGEDRAHLSSVALNVCNMVSATLGVPSLLPPDIERGPDTEEPEPPNPLCETDERKDALLACRLADSSFGFSTACPPPTLAPGTIHEPPRIMISSSSLSHTVSRRDSEAGVLSQLIALLESDSERVQEAAAWTLAELIRGKPDACVQLLRCTTPSGALITSLLLSLHTHPNLRLWVAALTCFAYLIKSRSFTSRTSAHVLFLLVGLLDEADIEVQTLAARAVARLVADDVALQTRAVEEFDVVPRLALVWAQAYAALLDSKQEGIERAPSKAQAMAQLGEAALSALAALAYDADAIRNLVISVSPAVLPTVVGSLKSVNAPLGVKVACMRLLRSLARSVIVLRTSLLDAGVTDAVLPHIAPRSGEDDEDILLAEALGVLADLVLSFSPMKPRLVGPAGCVAQVVASVSHGVEEVRLNALWVLKNLLYDSDIRTKEAVMELYDWDQLYLAAQAGGGTQEQALGIVRNLLAPGEEDVAFVLSHWSGRIYDLLDMALQDYAHDLASPMSVEQAAWTLANLAAGGQGVRYALLARSNLLDGVVSLLGDPYATLRDAGVVCAINLMRTSAAPFERTMAADAARTLQLFGLERELRSLVACEEVVDLQARARSALALLEQLAPSGSVTAAETTAFG